MDTRAGSTTEKIIDIDRIKQMIPHRYPFLMIDKVTEVDPGVSAVGIKNVTVNEPFFEGHFPSFPVMPGVLIVEAMAQTAAVLVMYTLGKEAEGRLVYFMSIEAARFRKPIRPGDSVRILVEKCQQRGSVWKFKGEARVNDTLMAEATYSAMIMDE